MLTDASDLKGTEEEVRNTSTQLAADLGAESGPLFWGAECEVDEVGIGGVARRESCVNSVRPVKLEKRRPVSQRVEARD